MTKEEIIQKGKKKFPPDIIEEISDGGKIVRTDVNATIRHAYIQGLIDNNCQLPSDIDEAAKKAYKEYDVKSVVKPKDHPVGFLFFDGFKAGAEWTARQGVSLSHLIAWYIQSVDAHDPVWTKEHLEELVKDYIVIPKN